MEKGDTDSVKDEKPYRLLLILLGALILIVVIHRLTEWRKDRPYKVETITVAVNSLDQIELLSDSIVKPILYSHINGLDQLETRKAKATFVSALLPAILVAKHRVKEDSLKLIRLTKKKKWNTTDSIFYNETKERLKASSMENLLVRMLSLPNSIVLAQAAIETGWGQSRFFLEGNNVFGIWSYNADEPRLQAGIGRETPIYVRAYNDISESIHDYFETLGSAGAYQGLRKARTETNDPFLLITHLKYYSERRNWYVSQLRTMIDQNNFTQYDNYKLDPKYVVPE
jgi:Bax protein